MIRAGVGLFYENSVWNNNLYDRPARLQQGLFLGFQTAYQGGLPVSYTLPGQTDVITPDYCGQRIGDRADEIAAAQAAFQAATLTAGPAVNSVFIGNVLSASNSGTGTNMFAPDYRTPRSVQMNVGFQHEFGKGIVWTADLVRNVGTRNLLAIDVNHVGDAQYLDVDAAIAAINATAPVKCTHRAIVRSRGSRSQLMSRYHQSWMLSSPPSSGRSWARASPM